MTRIGVLGGGQLGRMLALSGYQLGMAFRFLDHAKESPAAQVGELICGEFEDETSLAKFCDGMDVMTYEFENVPVSAVKYLESILPVFPGHKALEKSQDRLVEKEFLRSLDIPTADFIAIDRPETDLKSLFSKFEFPCILKTRRMGYDGKGQRKLTSHADADSAAAEFAGKSCVLELVVPFERELSLVAVRGRNGDQAFYPLVENEHRGGILWKTVAPAPNCGAKLQSLAEDFAIRLFDALDYVGVLAIELFELQGALVVNEIAPRVHNSGHWTIDGAVTSQFENHVRAIAGLPLGEVTPRGVSIMLNCIGAMPPSGEILRVSGAKLHDYGKSPRPGRKVGHVTVTAAAPEELNGQIAAIERLIANRL